jgi:flagellin
MYPVQADSIALEGIYSGMFAEINNLTSSILLSPAALSTTSTTPSYLLGAISENNENMDSVNSGISLLQANIDYLEQIKEKLDEMEDIAQDAATGSYTTGQLSEMQDQIEELAEEIDDIAAGELGETHLIDSDFGSVAIEIGNGLAISIATNDMTSQGLDIDNIDLTIDAEAALAAIQDAQDEVIDYDAYLDSKIDDLEAVALSLETQNEVLLAIQSAIESTDAAYYILNALNDDAMNTANLFLIAQANVTAQTVLDLLLDD